MMRFRFDANQEYWLDAVRAVVDLFEGQPPVAPGFSLQAGQSTVLAAIPNRLALDEQTLLANLRAVQQRNGIQPDEELKFLEETGDGVNGERRKRCQNRR